MTDPIFSWLQSRLSPAALAQVRASSKAALPYRLHPAHDLAATASRIGGIGYWPEERDYPRNAAGQPLALLAQFNLGELPPGAAQALGLPESGLLAFYIDPQSDLYGAHFDNPRDASGYRCVYFADTAAPSLTRDAQRALFSAAAFPYLDAGGDDDGDDDDNGDDDDGAVSALWQYVYDILDSKAAAPEATPPAAAEQQDDPLRPPAWEGFRMWLQQANLFIHALDDAALNRRWTAELTAFAAGLPAHLAHLAPLSFSHALKTLHAAFPQTAAYLAASTDPRAAQWAEGIYDAQSRFFATCWAADPAAEIRAWMTRHAAVAAHIGDDTLTRLWTAAANAWHGKEAALARQLQALHIGSIDALHEALTAEGAPFAACQRRIEALAQELPGDEYLWQPQMDGVPPLFWQDFVAENRRATARSREKLRRLREAMEACEQRWQAEKNDAPATAAAREAGGADAGGQLADWYENMRASLMNTIARANADSDPAEQAAMRAVIGQFLAAFDADVAAENHGELTQQWQAERPRVAALQVASPYQLSVAVPLQMPRSLTLWQQRHHAMPPAWQVIDAALPREEDWFHPVDGEYAVAWQPLTTRYLLHDNSEFTRHYGAEQPQWLGENGLDAQEIYRLLDSCQTNNTLGGDPYFTQYDPRAAGDDDVLLFQLDSAGHDSGVEVLWGDSGIGMFFIRPADLRARRFERAWFYWDCC